MKIGERVVDNHSVPKVDNNRISNDSENIDPVKTISISAEAINTRTGHLNFSHSASVFIFLICSKASLVFDSISGLHCYAEEILPAGSFVPSFRIRTKDACSLIGLDFKISCALSSLDLLLWATRENEKDTSMIKVLSQFLIRDNVTCNIQKDDWYCLNLDSIYLEHTTRVFIEIVNTNDKNPISEFEIEQIIFTPQNSSPVKVLQKRISQNTSPESSFTCSFDGCHRSFSRMQNHMKKYMFQIVTDIMYAMFARLDLRDLKVIY